MTDATLLQPPEELRFDPGGRDLAALRFGKRGGMRVLALHGWLDNAMSFAPLAEFLPELELVALDLPGHGHSAHRPAHTWYHYVDYLDDALAALDKLAWERCVLLGHSLGGAVASVLAAARPERVQRLVLIEALGPLAARPGNAVAALRQGLDERAAADAKQLRVFPDISLAVAARMQSNQLSESSARRLVERSVREVEGGLQWRSDPRLKIASPIRITESTIREWLAAIECPTLLIAAEPSPPYFNPETRRERAACVRDLREIVLPGIHHLHMETPMPVADAIHEFLQHDAGRDPAPGASVAGH
jgi:pimeloyl-ACP methyl ester carboxylesterase